MPHGFVHLRLHTEYSLSDSVVRVPELVAAVAAAGMPAVAVTDQGNLFAMVKFYREALKAGVKPLVGVDLLIAEEGERQPPTRLTLLCQSPAGYRNLARLVSRAYLEGQERGTPRIERAWLSSGELEGLIGLSCAAEGDVGRALIHGRERDAERSLAAWLTLFPGRFYLELQRLGRPFEETYIAGALALAARSGAPVVASNDVRFLRPEQFESHEARVCIHDGTLLADAGRVRRYSRQQYLRTPQEMAALFADLPEALANSAEIARRSSLQLTLGEVRLPQYPLPAGVSTEEFLREEAARGLAARFAASSGAPLPYRERLERELAVICQMGFAGYFLIVADFIRWAREHGVPVGPGRGSGAGSLVAYSLQITDLDPIRYDLLFERFLNPGRKSLPDIDMDFCVERRDEVIRYIKEKYGADRVAQIITFGTLKGKQAIKDVGRVLDFTFAETDRIAKLYPEPKQGKDFPLEQALEMEPRLRELRDSGERERRLLDLALRLEGLLRHASKHAAGIVISERPLTEDVPLWVDKDGAVVTQYSFNDIDAIGLIKFDFLGLKTLTLIESIVRRIREGRGVAVHTDRLPLDDAACYKLLGAADTIGVFQLESGGIRRMLTQLRPSCFADLVAVLALYRPGPLDAKLDDGRTMAEVFIQRKCGKEPVRYLHPALEPLLADTYGVIVYQEQVMQIAQALAGYSLGDADNLRRAMGKKKKEYMALERERFLAGVKQRGTAEVRLAGEIFDQMETFAAYGFNKSHSAAYALITYQTAYLKAHYPTEFMAGLLSLEASDIDNTYKNIAECRDRGIAILPPDVNESSEDFTVTGETIRFGLAAVKGVGSKAIEAILAAREDGPFTSLADFCLRVRGQLVNRRVIESLVKCGAF